MFGCQPKPGTKMLLTRKLAHICPDFRCHCLRQRYTKPIHYTQVHSADAFEMLANILRVLWRITSTGSVQVLLCELRFLTDSGFTSPASQSGRGILKHRLSSALTA